MRSSHHILEILCIVPSLFFPKAVGAELSQNSAAVVQDADLQKVARVPTHEFPWLKKHAMIPPPLMHVGENTSADDSGISLNNMKDIIISTGDINIKKTGEKEVITLGGKEKKVEIELPSQFALRGKTIAITRNPSNGQTESIDASGGIEMWSPDRQCSGEILKYETTFGARGEKTKDIFNIEGNRNTNVKAVLWHGDDRIEADKFVIDLRLNTFRAQGGPVAIVTLPDKNDSQPKTDQPPTGGGGGMLPDLSIVGGGKTRVQADGEMLYDGASGRITLSRNVVIQQQGATGTKISSDEASLTLALPMPGQPESNTGMFSGTPKSVVWSGRVEVQTATHFIPCDKAYWDLHHDMFVLEMNNPGEGVRIYQKDASVLYIGPKKLSINLASRELSGHFRTESFTGVPPSRRHAPEKK